MRRGTRTAWRDVVTVLALDQDGPRRNAAEQRHRPPTLFIYSCRLSAPQCVEGVPRDSRSGLRVTLLSNLFMGSLSVSLFICFLCHRVVRWCDKKRTWAAPGSGHSLASRVRPLRFRWSRSSMSRTGPSPFTPGADDDDDDDDDDHVSAPRHLPVTMNYPTPTSRTTRVSPPHIPSASRWPSTDEQRDARLRTRTSEDEERRHRLALSEEIVRSALQSAIAPPRIPPPSTEEEEDAPPMNSQLSRLQQYAVALSHDEQDEPDDDSSQDVLAFVQNMLRQIRDRGFGMRIDEIEQAMPCQYFVPAVAHASTRRQIEGGREECVICLSEMEDDDVVRLLPCSHIMHAECVDTWLSSSPCCPCCKAPCRGDRVDGAPAS